MLTEDQKADWTEAVNDFAEYSARFRVERFSSLDASLRALEPWTDNSWGVFGRAYETYQALRTKVAQAYIAAQDELRGTPDPSTGKILADSFKETFEDRQRDLRNAADWAKKKADDVTNAWKWELIALPVLAGVALVVLVWGKTR